MVLCFLAVWMLAGCGSREPAEDIQAGQLSGESIGPGEGQEGSNLAGIQGNGGAMSDPSQEEQYMEIPEGQILDQSFEITLDGWGKVTFASFEPEQDTFQKDGVWMYGDARFMLLKDGKAVYAFPEIFESNGMRDQQFSQVCSAAFRDYNEDGRPDVLLILEYAGVQGIDIGTTWMEVRAYTQKEGEKAFYPDSVVAEYVNRNAVWGEPVTMEGVVKSLAEYAGQYSMITALSAWEVERFAGSIREEILSGDFESLSRKIAFPIVIGGRTYANKEEFLAADFVSAPDGAFLDAIKLAPVQNLFCNWQGVMLGNGQVWFAEAADNGGSGVSTELQIIAINGISGEEEEQAVSADYWRLQEEVLNERMEYYRESAYYQEMAAYWENVRGVTDIANQTDFLFDTDSRYYTAEDFQGEPSLVIHLAKNEIYARHGYIFEDTDLYHYFMGCIWYTPAVSAKDFDASVFNEYERENVKVLAGLDDF